MEKIRLTKSGLRQEQYKLQQLRIYLPTLKLKKAMLQQEIYSTQMEIHALNKKLILMKEEIEKFAALLEEKYERSILSFIEVKHVQKRYENIAGVEIPVFEAVIFPEEDYSLFDSPIWFDSALSKIKKMLQKREEIYVVEEKKRALEKEFRDVSIRVNLFEKILIPRALGNIKKIMIFLGDQELASVATSKVAKVKILERKREII